MINAIEPSQSSGLKLSRPPYLAR
jgi:hypothetical protein